MLSEDTATSDAPLASDLETSLAPREGEMLSLPFDQYGRMRIAQNLAHILYTEIARQAGQGDGPYRLRILDVGGYPGTLREFLNPDYFELTVLDVVPDDGSIPGYVQGSGMELPYAESEFDLVFSLDTLEHIPGHERPRFLSEVKRVARLGVVLINPIQSLQADLAEETLDEYVRWILDAQQEQLAEHREYGLPDFAATTETFRQDGWQTHNFKLANVYNWLLMMIAKHYLLSMQDERAAAFERALDRYYNLSFFESDRSEPAYRGAMIAVRPGLEQAIERIGEAYPPVAESDSANATRLGLTEVLMSLLNLKTANHEDHRLREQMERRDRHIAEMETKSALQDVQIDSQRAQIEAHTAQIEWHKVQHNAQAEAYNAQIEAYKEQAESLREHIQSQKEQNESLTDMIERLNEHIRNIEAAYKDEFANQVAYIARLEGDLKSKDEHILYLERLLRGIESGRVFRVTRSLSRFLKR